jgi:polar amino acid transport system ATP-binding protein
VIIDDLSLDVPASQKLAVIGPSGSGKTTLLRLLMTLERPDSGHIEIHGDLLAGPEALSETQVRKVRGQIGMVFQHFNLFPHMTALENVTEAPRYVGGLPKAQAEVEAAELLRLVGLADKAARYPRQLSGGQQQRVAIARALAMHPKVMLFDEVTSALDPELVGEVLRVVRRLAEETSMTMIIVTHEMNFARDVSDRVIFMEKGRVIEDRAPDAMFTAPVEERTREFLRAVINRE